MRVLDIIEGTIVDGPGLRTGIYFAGCAHQCPGCHNPESWDFDAGTEMTVDRLVEVVALNGFNVSLTGGDPLYQIDNGLLELCEKIKELGLNIWCYTGFTIEEIARSEKLKRILAYVDVIVDGPFIESRRNLSLRFRGSDNQRIIDVNSFVPDSL